MHHIHLPCRVSNLLRAFVVALAAAIPASAQTYTILHNFTGGSDGAGPYAGLSIDRGGNLFGTATMGGRGYGVVFEMSPKNSAWIFRPLYSFAGGADGEGPLSRAVIGPNGTLYGTTYGGGDSACANGCGTVYNIRPPATPCKAVSCSWNEAVLYRFHGPDGANPLLGDLSFDVSGNIYGTTESGGIAGCGTSGCGTVYELSHSAGSWTEGVLYKFTGGSSDGAYPYSGVILDQAGNIYGTTNIGGSPGSNGTVFRLSNTGSGWLETVLYTFTGQNDGYAPVGGLIFDSSGSLLGTTSSGGTNNGGIAFSLTTSGSETVLFNFVGSYNGGPYGNLTIDAAGDLYGMTYDDGAYGNGAVFKLTPTANGWVYTDLHDFNGTDGRCPYGNVVIDAQGNLYGTTMAGGQYDSGVVWEITP
jgi:uncharacterized repeat protein (TIGR03803 family)